MDTTAEDTATRKPMLYGRIVEADELRALGQDIMEFHVDMKEATPEKRLFKGYASTGAVDRVGDIVEPGAFKRTFRRYLKGNPAILAHHSPFIGIGTATDAEIVDNGLMLSGLIGTGTNPMDDIEIVWNRMSQRIYRALSIGFRIMKREDIVDGGQITGWRIKELDLYEVSVVAIPANPEALFDISKAVHCGTDLDFDLYARGLWGIPPKIIINTKSAPRPAVRPGRTLTEIDARIGGLLETVAAHAGGTR